MAGARFVGCLIARGGRTGSRSPCSATNRPAVQPHPAVERARRQPSASRHLLNPLPW
jgi:hypothetical protein